jgi:hypothetical protein
MINFRVLDLDTIFAVLEFPSKSILTRIQTADLRS